VHFVTGIKGSLFDGGGHKMTAVAIGKAGYTRVMGGMHAEALKYWRSTRPVKIRPDSSNADDLLQMRKIKAMVSGKDGRIGYPMFFKDATDALYLIYRDGSAGSAKTVINTYDANEQKWSRLATLFTRPGSVYSTKPVLGPDGHPVSAALPGALCNGRYLFGPRYSLPTATLGQIPLTLSHADSVAVVCGLLRCMHGKVASLPRPLSRTVG
jgi:hypothetical protein